MEALIFSFCFLAIGAWCYYLFSRSSAKLPPGPFSFPIVGTLFSLKPPLHRHFAALSRKYGPVVYLKIGMVPYVVVNDAAAAEQVLKIHDLEFANRRVKGGFFRFFSFEWRDIAFSPMTKSWRTMRRICKTHLFSNTMLNLSSHFRQSELQITLDSILELCNEGKPVNLKKVFGRWISGSLSLTLLGRKGLEQALDLVAAISAQDLSLNVGELIPALDWLDLHGVNAKMKNEIMPQIKSLLQGILQEHRKNKHQAGDKFACKDFIDVLQSVQQQEGLEDISLVAMLSDMLFGGLDTTKGTLEWAMGELINNAQIMVKAQQELDQVIGKSRCVEESDVPNLPYIQAIMKEVLRLHPAFPLGVPHFNEQQAKIGEYTIPAGCKILVNIWAVGQDPAYWEQPEEFRPERFLDGPNLNVDISGQSFQLIPFSSGRRICPGYPLAMRSMCLLLAALLQRFEWSSIQGGGIKLKEGLGTASCKMDTDLILRAHPRF